MAKWAGPERDSLPSGGDKKQMKSLYSLTGWSISQEDNALPVLYTQLGKLLAAKHRSKRKTRQASVTNM